MKQLKATTLIAGCATLGAVIWIALASAAFAYNDTPDPDPEPDPPGDVSGDPAPSPEPESNGGEGTTCKDRIPACTIFKSPPRPVTNQNYGGKL